VKFAYADPPYIGQAKRHYNCVEVDHQQLLWRLQRDYSDGWVLSLNSTTLQYILTLCPVAVRIGAWVKPFAAFKKHVNPAYTWEPVIFYGGRNHSTGKGILTTKDHVIESITLKKGLVGAKPLRFCLWILDLLGFEEGDSLDDLYPGTNIMSKAIKVKLEHNETFTLS